MNELSDRALEFRPLAEIFPFLHKESVRELADDIHEHGLRHAIVTYDGKILDGRNRHRACLGAGVEPWFKEYAGAARSTWR